MCTAKKREVKMKSWKTKAAPSVGSEPCPDSCSYFLSGLPYSIPVEPCISISISETTLYMKNINCIKYYDNYAK